MDENLKKAMIWLFKFLLSVLFFISAPLYFFSQDQSGIEPPVWIAAILGLIASWLIPGTVVFLCEFLGHLYSYLKSRWK